MDLDEFRSILTDSKVDVWTLIETAISLACTDYDAEFKRRRDSIVERLYTPVVSQCRNCDRNHRSKPNSDGFDKHKHQLQAEVKDCNGREVKRISSSSPESLDRVEEDDEQRRIISIKKLLEDPNQSENCLVDLLKSLARMDITFEALKETDIGRHVNGLRKHSSNEVRRLVKQLVRKWKDLVDEWVSLNTPAETAVSLMAVGDGGSPHQNHPRSDENGHHLVLEQEKVIPHRKASSTRPPLQSMPASTVSLVAVGDGGSPHQNHPRSDENGHRPVLEQEKVIPHKKASSTRPLQSMPAYSSPVVTTPMRQREVQESVGDTERLALATKRLHENYQEAQNAKRQRTVQVMDLNDIPKPKNTFFAKSRGGVQAKH